MKKYARIAVGGTFDILHKGHEKLINETFKLADEVFVGLTSDKFAEKLDKQLINSYSKRSNKLENYIRDNFSNSSYKIFELSDYFGPAIFYENLDAFIVTAENQHRINEVNEERGKRGIPLLKAEVIELVRADDGKPISTTRIKRLEIDNQGNLLKKTS